MRLPREDYLGGSVPQCFFMTRESYERLLRSCVRGFSSNIKWITGTATGLTMITGRVKEVDSVVVRLPSGEEQEIKASLVIGETSVLRLVFPHSVLIISRLFGEEPSWIKMAKPYPRSRCQCRHKKRFPHRSKTRL